MSRLDELPPDQRAALSLLLRQHKSYGEVAALLHIPERAVHDRAHAALAVLAPRQARELTPDWREDIGEYLLSQQLDVAERLRTRTYLNDFEPARVWARELASQLETLPADSLPDIPGPEPAPQRLQDLSVAAAPPVLARARPQRSSRLGGALLLAAIVAAVVIVIVLVSGGSSHKNSASKTSSTSAKTGPTVENEIALKPPNSKSGSIGVVDILAEDGKRAFFIEADHIPSSNGFYYAIWLYNSPTSSLPLSKSPSVGATHRLAGGSLLPTDAGNYREILLTRENTPHPTHPGHIVLRGKFNLGN